MTDLGGIIPAIVTPMLDEERLDGLPRVQMGQTSDEFKARLGCSAVRLFCYVKVSGVLRPFVMANIKSLFPPPKPWQPRDIYKS